MKGYGDIPKGGNFKSEADMCAAEVGPGKKYDTVEQHLDAKLGAFKEAPLTLNSAADALVEKASPKSFDLNG